MYQTKGCLLGNPGRRPLLFVKTRLVVSRRGTHRQDWEARSKIAKKKREEKKRKMEEEDYPSRDGLEKSETRCGWTKEGMQKVKAE